jgi:hypothetical protein
MLSIVLLVWCMWSMVYVECSVWSVYCMVGMVSVGMLYDGYSVW